MPAQWEQVLARWQDAGLIDPDGASRIREFEQTQSGSGRLRWPAILAISLGGLLLMAGVLLFVSAHWEDLAPSRRFASVVAMVAVFHLGGAYASRSRMEALAIALHGAGSAALGAGIYLSGQIFNMSEHWPAGILMWAAGAWMAWALRRDWLQLTFVAILTPAWVGAEWMDSNPSGDQFVFRTLAQGMLLLAITYFTSTRWKPLIWIGGISLLPWTLTLALSYRVSGRDTGAFWGSAVALALPLVLAFVLRKKSAVLNAVAAVWVFVLNLVSRNSDGPLLYLWCGIGAAGLIAWGMYEHRGERVNLGMAGFAITILFFYFSSVMDKLGRSESLIGLGVLFLAGGWALEKLRRRLVARI
jgi:uncharacterized membrane protein